MPTNLKVGRVDASQRRHFQRFWAPKTQFLALFNEIFLLVLVLQVSSFDPGGWERAQRMRGRGKGVTWGVYPHFYLRAFLPRVPRHDYVEYVDV